GGGRGGGAAGGGGGGRVRGAPGAAGRGVSRVDAVAKECGQQGVALCALRVWEVRGTEGRGASGEGGGAAAGGGGRRDGFGRHLPVGRGGRGGGVRGGAAGEACEA